MTEFLLKWAISFAQLYDAIFGIISFGRYNPSIALKCARQLARYRTNKKG